MLISEIIAQLQTELPKYTDFFTDNVDITLLTRAGSTVTAQTSTSHNYKTGNFVNICNSKSSNPLVSLTQQNGLATAVTSLAHDKTEGFVGNGEISLATISGANEAEYNGTFDIVNVPNRFSFTYRVPLTTPAAATGSVVLEEGNVSFRTYNGLYQITSTPTANTFTYELDSGNEPTSPAVVSGNCKSNHRISGGADLDVLVASYNQNQRLPNDFWAFVDLDATVASKDRQDNTDFIHTNIPNADKRQFIIQNFHIYIFAPAINGIANREVRDTMQLLFPAINKAVLNFVFPSEYASGTQYGAAFLQHGPAIFESPFYVHDFQYQQRADLTFCDALEPFTRSFRDIHIDYINVNLEKSDIILTTDINLDEDS